MLILPTCVCHIRHHRGTYVAFLATLTYVVRRYYLGTLVSEVFVYHCHVIIRLWSGGNSFATTPVVLVVVVVVVEIEARRNNQQLKSEARYSQDTFLCPNSFLNLY